ncbi:head-tail connector protein [Allosphingosinicella vermicomposti]|uniref:head-tail connector protein n=1 Tax=Allosphingosinicella vermicomposti TaxID=614671 RepID=UPI000D0E9E6B|nr:hypothetical protein [Allosphingosinicella vermicomposti]
MGQVIEGGALEAALAAVKAYVRVEGTGEDAVLGAMTASAVEMCEAFIGQWLVARDGSEAVERGVRWQRLKARPVVAIMGVEPLVMGAFEIDIDADGCGWVRLLEETAEVPRALFRAGMAAEWGGLPEALRHGIVRLAAHLYAARDGAGNGAPPAVVTALWRPYRHILFGRAS